MNIQNNILDLIPVDLLHEIFSRLPVKSVGRWRCVSKKLASILGSEDFKQVFLTRSLTRPCLLFVYAQNKYRCAFYSLRQPQNEKSSLVLIAECPRLSLNDLNYASGLCLSSTFMFGEYLSIVISNPSTGQYVILPEISELGFKKCPKNFLGFDPIDKQFKILLMDGGGQSNDFILTLGTGKMRWRTIKCPDYSYIYPTGICINGVLYCLAGDNYDTDLVIVCFDVRTETFKSKFLVSSTTQDRLPELINCKGKLGITILRKRVESVELDMWVVEEDQDVEKPEWSKYTLPIINLDYSSVVGMTSTGEIILLKWNKPNYLYYFNLEKKSHQSVEVQDDLENHNYCCVIIDHVEDLYVNDAKYFIDANPREAPPRESINTFEALCLSDEEDDDD